MAKIILPSKNAGDSEKSGGDTNVSAAATEIASLKSQMESLTSEIGASNTERRNAEAKAAEESKTKEQEELEANADLSALLKEVEETDESPSKSKIDDMNNTELLDIIATSVDTAIEAQMTQLSKSIGEKVASTNKALDGICKFLGQMQASAGLESARSKHADFDQFREDTRAVMKTYPQMDVEHAYLLAKSLRVGDSPPANEVETEYPTGWQPMRGTMEKKVETSDNKNKEMKPPATQHGVVGFRNILNARLAKSDLKSAQGR